MDKTVPKMLSPLKKLQEFPGLVTLAFFFVVMTLLRLSHPFYLTLGFWDAPITINGAYRLFEGLVPHRDYQSPLGPVSFMIPAFGMVFLGKTMAGYQLGVLSFGFLCSAVTYLSLRRSGYTEIIATLISLASASYLLSTRCLSYEPVHLGLVGIYNLEGYAILCFLVAEALSFAKVSSATSPTKLDPFLGFCASALAVAAVFLKITFGVVSIVFLALAFFGCRKSAAWRRSAILGLGLSSLFWLFVFRFEVWAIAQDYLIVLLSRPPDFSNLEHTQSIQHLFLKHIRDSSPMAAVALGVIMAISFRSSNVIRLLAMTGLILGSEYFLLKTIAQAPEFYVVGIFGLMILGGSLVDSSRSIASRRWLTSALMITVGYFFWFISQKNWWSIHYLARLVDPTTNEARGGEVEFTQSKNFYDLHAIGPAAAVMNELVTSQEICGFSEPKIITAGFPNIYTPMKGAASPRRTALYEHYGVTFSQKAKDQFPGRFDPEIILSDVDVIAVPRSHVGHETIDGFFHLYEGFMAKNFREDHQFSNWRIYCRSSPGAQESYRN